MSPGASFSGERGRVLVSIELFPSFESCRWKHGSRAEFSFCILFVICKGVVALQSGIWISDRRLEFLERVPYSLGDVYHGLEGRKQVCAERYSTGSQFENKGRISRRGLASSREGGS